jgi:hypothetical protein
MLLGHGIKSDRWSAGALLLYLRTRLKRIGTSSNYLHQAGLMDESE